MFQLTSWKTIKKTRWDEIKFKIRVDMALGQKKIDQL
jgi:hypothetical protein